MSNYSVGQFIALEHYLSDYPDNMNFAHLTNEIMLENPEIIVWPNYEQMSDYHLMQEIRTLARKIDSAIVKAVEKAVGKVSYE